MAADHYMKMMGKGSGVWFNYTGTQKKGDFSVLMSTDVRQKAMVTRSMSSHVGGYDRFRS